MPTMPDTLCLLPRVTRKNTCRNEKGSHDPRSGGHYPGRARKEVPDAYLPGLYFVVQPTGAKSWAVRYRHAGRPRKHTLGPYPRIDLKAARELGAEALRVAAEGRDPGRGKTPRGEGR